MRFCQQRSGGQTKVERVKAERRASPKRRRSHSHGVRGAAQTNISI